MKGFNACTWLFTGLLVGVAAAQDTAAVLSQVSADLSAGRDYSALVRLRQFEALDPKNRTAPGVTAFLASIYSRLGLHAEALAVYDRENKPKPPAPNNPLIALESRGAAATIAKLIGQSRLVMINEAHHVAQHRLLAIELLGELKKAGFTHFAAETLDEKDTGLSERGFATPASGFYSSEPLFAELIRTALKLGFQVVPYEGVGYSNAEEREAMQTQNIVKRVFEVNPAAKLFVYAGYGHVDEMPRAKGVQPLAFQLKRATGLDPFTINQTSMSERSAPAFEDPWYRYAADELKIAEATIFVDENGTPWSHQSGGYDVTVFLPRSVYTHARPQWLSMAGKRTAVPLQKKVCGRASECLVTARYASEPHEAIPVDQLLVESDGQRSFALVLPHGEFAVTVWGADGANLRSFKIKR